MHQTRFVRSLACGALAPAFLLAAICGTAPASAANDVPVIMQWFESRWIDMERRVPDWYVAGYGAVWLPPPTKGSNSTSAGYDVWDRFDLGSPASQTAYGTEDYFRAVVGELHQANGLVYIDAVLNHCSGRQTSASFQAAGGYPGFWMAPANPPVDKTPTSNWGDFHNGNASGYLQSQDPNSANYDLYKGDLVSLVDIAQESNNQFIRQPVEEGNPDNIPAGTSVNKPKTDNYRCYPDQGLTPKAVVNPGTARNPGTNNFTFYPFNTVDPLQGDPVKDNTTGLLMRWTQWMLDDLKVDGFRFDAIKHAPSWFWDVYIDSVMYQRRITPDGRAVTPYSFGECVESNSFTYNNFVRKDSFGNRDCLDINGSGALRNIVNAGGFGNWQDAVSSHLDNQDDGYNNGSIGVNHTFSHDNGTTGDGNSAPPNPTARQMGYAENCYVLMRPGPVKLYHNARGITRSSGFWPKGGIITALGLNTSTNVLDPTVTTLVQLHNWYARGEFNIINSTDTVNPSTADALIFERRTPLGGGAYSGNVLVGVNDRYDAGYDERNVLTSFPAGTRLREMTGNATDPVVDPTNSIFDVITVGADKRVTIRVPTNKTGTNEHGKGYVVYGPAIPSGTLTLTNTSGALPADSTSVASAARRLFSIPVIKADTFSIQLTTTQTDPLDPNTDDNAVFAIDQGFRDFNGNGYVDIDYTSSVVPGYEQFVTLRQPLYGSGNSQGQYQQTIDATQLSEGLHYISVVAFRKRNSNEAPLYREFRQPVYIDRTGPDFTTQIPDEITTSSYKFTVNAADRTAYRMHIIRGLAEGADLIAACNVNNQCARNDRFEWFRTVTGFTTHGYSRVTVVAFEENNTANVKDYNVWVNKCPADFDRSGFADFDDFNAFVAAFEAGDISADFDKSGFVDFDDFNAFVSVFEVGC